MKLLKVKIKRSTVTLKQNRKWNGLPANFAGEAHNCRGDWFRSVKIAVDLDLPAWAAGSLYYGKVTIEQDRMTLHRA